MKRKHKVSSVVGLTLASSCTVFGRTLGRALDMGVVRLSSVAHVFVCHRKRYWHRWI